MAEEEDVESWQELLPRNPLFARLRESKSVEEGKRNLMCEIRGDLFVWSSNLEALLTTNLKRIVANLRSDDSVQPVFQELKCTHPPKSNVILCLPDPSGQYIALQCERGVSVMTLSRHRGSEGEFGGGTGKVMCKVVTIANDFFTIYQYATLQVNWHLTAPFQLAILTADNVIRFYSLADPDLEFLSIALPSSPTAGVLSMKEPVVGFDLWQDSMFILQDDSVVTLTPLTQGTPPPSPLLMHPQVDDDCDNDATSILVLPSHPCVVVIATTSGMLNHCIYLEDDEEIEDLRDESGQSKRSLYIVESISFDIGESSSLFPSSLILDPLHPHTYYAVHSEGVHQVTLPWLQDLEKYTHSDSTSESPAISLSPLEKDKEAKVELFLQTEPTINWLEGVTIVSEPMLGLTLIGLTSDWDCLALPLHRSVSAPSSSGFSPSPRRLISNPHQGASRGFQNVIEEILKPDRPGILEAAPSLRSFSGKKNLTQAECYRFLSMAITELRSKHLLQQKKAKEKLKQKIQTLREQKEHIISDKLRIDDDIEDLATKNNELLEKLEQRRDQCKSLEGRLVSLVCQVERQSPVLSQAEEWMRDEVEGLSSHMQVMHKRLLEGHRKLEVCCGPGHTPKVDVSARQSSTILSTLTESGNSIKNLMVQVQSLKEAVHGLTNT